jgi:hypothetical protein
VHAAANAQPCIIIIGMPPHIIMHGIPMFIMFVIMDMRSFIMSICDMSIGIILQIMPSLPISIVILHIIGMPIMPMGMGIGIGIIIGIGIGIGIMPMLGFIIPMLGFIIPIIGFIAFIMGLMPPIIGIPPIGIEFIIGIPMLLFIIGVAIAFIMMPTSYGVPWIAQAEWPARAGVSSAPADRHLARRMIRPSMRTERTEQRRTPVTR